MKAQKCQVTVQEQAGKPFWGHNFSGTVDDSQPDLDDRYIPIQRVLAGQRGDVMGQVEGSHLAHMTRDLSIQNVASNAEILRTTPTSICHTFVIGIEDYG